jgi:peptide/nickel transport system substrate-binding protein
VAKACERPCCFLGDWQKMKKLRWQILIVLFALIAIAILLLGQQPVVETNVPEPTTGGLYIEGVVGVIGRLNPLLDTFNSVDRDIDRLIYSRLIRFDEYGNPVPDLAEKWGISLGGTEYNFTLRSNAQWHDGEPVTTDDVIFTIELMRSPELPIMPDLRAFWEEIEVVKFDERNMQFILPEPFTPFLVFLNFGILPEHLVQGLTPAEIIDSQFNLEPVGSGPYEFEQLLIEDGEIIGVVLNAFDDYYKERAYIDQIVFRFYQDPIAALSAYQEGEIQAIGTVSDELLEPVLEEPELNLYSGVMPRLNLVFLNLDNSDVPFFQDKIVREALLLGINRQWIIGRILKGQAVIADSPIFFGSWAYYPSLEIVEYNPDKAISLLKSAGYTLNVEGTSVREKDGVQLAFELVHPDLEIYERIAEAIQSDLERIGVKVTLNPGTYDEILTDYLEPRNYEAALVELNLSGNPDPDPYPFWHQAQMNNGQNYGEWDDRRASEYLEQARFITRVNERIRLYKNFQVHFSKEVPAILLYYPVYNYAVDGQVQGVQIGSIFEPADRFLTIEDWFLVARGGQAEETLTPTGESLE